MSPLQAAKEHCANGASNQYRRLTGMFSYPPPNIAALCGRSPTWGYRQIYAGRIKAIADCGRLLIPRSEVDSFLARKAEYNPVTVGGGAQ
jgi:hypothetical protein